MPTMTNPTMNKAGQAGHALYTEYRRAREQHILMRRERLARSLPRAALRAAPVALLFALVFAFGLRLPVEAAVAAFLVTLLAWPALVMIRAFDPVPDIETLRELALAERKVAHVLERLRRHGFIVMHDRDVPNSEAVVSHLLVGPGGVMVLSSDTHKGVVRYSKSGAQVDGENLKPVIDRTAWQGVEVKNQLLATLPTIKIPVFSILVMVEAGVLWKDGAQDGVTIISLKDVVGYLRKKKTQLNPAQVKQVGAALERLFPAYSANRLADHITVERDQWLMLMDALRTIRERDGDASDMLERLSQIEGELARQADLTSRVGVPSAIAVDDDGGVEGVFLPDDSGMAPVTNLASAAAKPVRRRRLLTSSRPPRRAGQDVDAGKATGDDVSGPDDL